MQKSPLVSVIIATYNGKEKWFKQTIESVLKQSYNNIELIIVNDASTNNVEETILNYCGKYSNITYLKNEKNCERSFSRNRGIFESKGKYIAFLDDDDVRADKDKIKKQIELLEKNEDCVICGTSLTVIDKDNNKNKNIVLKSGDNNIRLNILAGNQFVLSGVLIRRDILCFSGLFNSNMNLCEDYDLWLRIGKYGKMDNISDSFVWYRTWEGNTTTLSNFSMKFISLKLCCKYRNYYPNFLKSFFYRLIIDFILPKKVISFLSKLKKN